MKGRNGQLIYFVIICFKAYIIKMLLPSDNSIDFSKISQTISVKEHIISAHEVIDCRHYKFLILSTEGFA